MSRIGEQIKEARIKQGLTQKQLAKKVGVAEKYIQEVEAGTKIINEDILEKITKVVGEQIHDSLILETYIEKEETKPKSKPVMKPKEPTKKTNSEPQPEIQEIWSDALGGVLADIPVFDYTLTNKLSTKQLPIISKKIEGYPKEKVLYIKIMDNDMNGFRIVKDDLAFCLLTHQLDTNSICLLEYEGRRVIRQIKKLNNDTVLLVSNSGSVKTHTVQIKEITILAKLIKIEFVL